MGKRSPIQSLERILVSGKGLKRMETPRFEDMRRPPESLGVFEASYEGDSLRAEVLLDTYRTTAYLTVTRGGPESPPRTFTEERITRSILVVVSNAQLKAGQLAEDDDSLTITSKVGRGAIGSIDTAIRLAEEREQLRKPTQPDVAEEEPDPLGYLRTVVTTYQPKSAGEEVHSRTRPKMSSIVSATMRRDYEEVCEYERVEASFGKDGLTVRRVRYRRTETGEESDFLHITDFRRGKERKEAFLKCPRYKTDEWISGAFAEVSERASDLEGTVAGYSFKTTSSIPTNI